MTRTTPELAPPSPNFRATPTGGRLATTYDLVCNRPYATGNRPYPPCMPVGIHGGSSVESGFEPATLRSRGRDLTTRPPRPQFR
ncbi:hypothetical protein AVEN_23965-1 [Araneus ventricosus]|uniref:Uncharacterized protein n=1 Tax=Araneus ventricosus TaxID=182803 RepID=A0A4Y2Q2F6_ARAVE|nr:hypothetical protein AVEN_23965-1 [Araneus ventricosus]